MRVVYIAHALGQGEDREKNRAAAARWVAWAASQGFAPVATWITLAGEWDESSKNRERGIAIDSVLVERCDEVWLCGGRITPGMQHEADHARLRHILVRDLTRLGPEPSRWRFDRAMAWLAQLADDAPKRTHTPYRD